MLYIYEIAYQNCQGHFVKISVAKIQTRFDVITLHFIIMFNHTCSKIDFNYLLSLFMPTKGLQFLPINSHFGWTQTLWAWFHKQTKTNWGSCGIL